MAIRSRSRLTKHLQEQTRRNFTLIIIGVILIPLLLLTVVLPFFANAILFVTGGGKNATASNSSSVDYVAPPTINSLPDATNKSEIDVSGSAAKDQTISLYVHDDLVEKLPTKDDGSFKFNSVTLSQGKNEIKVKAVTKDKKQSDFSQVVTIFYLNKEPSLEMQSPTNGQTFSKDDSPISVSGKTDPGVTVTVNDFLAIVDSQGSFTARLSLKGGENTIKIVATDKAGNKKEQEIKVIYNP